MTSSDPNTSVPQSQALIQCLHLWKWYTRGQNVFQDANVQIRKGDFVFLMAPSGEGKSTLIRVLMGIEPVNRGHVLFEGRSIEHIRPKDAPYFRRRVGVVFQDLKLLPYRTVFENAALPLEVAGRERDMVRRKVTQLLHLLGLDHKMSTLCGRLSRGEQYLVAIARAVANDPVMLLVDEPSGNIEEDTLGDVLSLFLNLNAQGATVLIASHEPSLPQSVPEARVLAIHEGKILEKTQSSNTTYWR